MHQLLFWYSYILQFLQFTFIKSNNGKKDTAGITHDPIYIFAKHLAKWTFISKSLVTHYCSPEYKTSRPFKGPVSF